MTDNIAPAPSPDPPHGLASVEGRPRLTARDVERIISEYHAIVLLNTTDPYDAVAAVVDDKHGEVGWEVVQTAEELGYVLSEADVDRLFRAAYEYRSRVRIHDSPRW